MRWRTAFDEQVGQRGQAQSALVPVGVGGEVQYFTNGFRTRTRGIDVVGTWRTKLSEALLNFSLAYNYNQTKVRQYDARIIDDAQLIDAENLAPKHRAVFNASWSLDNLSFTVRENYYNSFTSAQDYGQTNGVANQIFGAKFTTDLELSYTFADHVTLAVGAQNFTDEHPDRLKPTSAVQISRSRAARRTARSIRATAAPSVSTADSITHVCA